MKIKQVLFICDYEADYGGNFIASVECLSDFLNKSDIKVTYIFPEGSRKKAWIKKLNNYNVYFTQFNKKSVEKEIENIIAQSKNNDEIIIHTHFIEGRKWIPCLNKFAHYSNVKVVVHEHIHLRTHNIILDNLYSVYCRIRFRKLNFIGVSSAVCQELNRKYGKHNVFLVKNSIDTSRFNKENKISNKNNILIFGTLYKTKGVDTAIKALENSKIKIQVVLLIVVNQKYVDITKKKIKKQFGRIPNFVRIISAVSDVQQLYDKSFLFLSPSRKEAFCYSAVEAAYCGREVIASDIPGQNTLKDIPYIRWIPSGDVEALKRKIEYIFNLNKEIMYDEGIINKKIINKNYSLEKWINSVYSVYLKLK